jgi:hypothetical protein
MVAKKFSRSLSVDVSVVVADDWEETSRMRVTPGKVYHHLVVLGSFGRAVPTDGVVADVGRAGSDDDPHVDPEEAFAELRVGYDVLLLAASCERGFTAPYACRDTQ